MNDDQFNKLFTYMRGEFNDIRAELATKASAESVERLTSLVDADLKQRETDEHERTAMASLLDRHGRWIEQLSRGTGVKLSTE